MSQNVLPMTVMIGASVNRKFSCRANVQRKPSPRPTENGFAILTPLRFRRYFANDDACLSPHHLDC